MDGGWYYDFVVYHVLLAVFLFRGVDGALEFASSDSRFPASDNLNTQIIFRCSSESLVRVML